jgi:hypothetical protein
MRTFILALVSAAALAGCAYKSSYRQTNFETDPKPVAAEQVKVARSADDLVSQYSELGRYKGRAPTLNEAMDGAKQWCGSYGADLFVLDHDPTSTSSGRYEIEGTCGLIDPTTTPDHIKKAERQKRREERREKRDALEQAENKKAKQAAKKKKAKQAAKKKKAKQAT